LFANQKHIEEVLQEVEKPQPKKYRALKWSDISETLQKHLYDLGISMKEYNFDKDLLISAIVWHDFGKIYEYTHLGDHNKYKILFPFANDIEKYDQIMAETTTGIDMDPLGKLLGHIPIGMMMFQKNCEHLQLDLETIIKYQHAIVAHHGKKEWGSPITPQTPEAFLLTIVDSLDARYMSMN
jgi:3'-5' exoribonuclease